MTTRKLLVIESCACCKFVGTNWLDGKIDGTRCLKAMRKIETNVRTTIPDWCPLPDAPKRHADLEPGFNLENDIERT